jgi:hypothetical protein
MIKKLSSRTKLNRSPLDYLTKEWLALPQGNNSESVRFNKVYKSAF